MIDWSKDIIHLDGFGGCAGFWLALKNAGINITKHYYSEIDKHAIAVANYHDKELINVGAIENVLQAGIERPHIFTFGSPCQDFSLAGKRAGLGGKRSSLITQAIEIIDKLRPSVFIWENVKGTFSSNNGADFWAILSAFTNLGGYRLEWQLLNTVWFLPQNRERIFLVGHLAGESEPKIFPIGEEISRSFEGPKQTANTFTAGGNSGGLHSSMTLIKSLHGSDTINTIRTSGRSSYSKKHSWDIVKCGTLRTFKDGSGFREIQSGNAPTITARGREDGNGQPVIKIASGTKSGYELAQNGDGIRLDHLTNLSNGSNTGRGRVQKAKANTIDTQSRHGVLTNEKIRRLTEIECERLQGFPDNWTQWGIYDGVKKEVSSTQRYKMMGNAISPVVVTEIGRRLVS